MELFLEQAAEPATDLQCKIEKLAPKTGWDNNLKDNGPPKPARNDKPQATAHTSLHVFKTSCHLVF